MSATARRFLHFTVAAALALLVPFASAQFSPPARLTVVTEINYPPFLFLGDDGEPRGILKDKWALWSEKTGIPVLVMGMEWKMAQDSVLAGTADIIEALSYTEARTRLYEYSRPYAPIEARIYFHRSISGINDLASLRGFRIGAKEGSACASWLVQNGVKGLQGFSSSEALVRAAGAGEVSLFCMDAPAAQYFLYKLHLEEEFRQTPPLYSSQFHWAVAKGRGELRDFIERGFDRIPAAALVEINERWVGKPVGFPVSTQALWYLLFAGLAVALAAALLALWNRMLRRQVSAATGELVLVANSVPVMLAHWGRDLRCRWANERYAAYYGYTADQLPGRHMHDLVGREYFDELWPNFERVLAGETVSYEASPPGSGGERRLFHVYLVPERDLEGKVQGWCGMLHDITERKRAEAALRESEMQLVAFMENSPSIIFMKNAQGRYLHANRQYLQAFGLEQTAVLGRTDAEIFDAHTAAQFMANDQAALKRGAPIAVEETVRLHDGTHTGISYKFPIFDSEGRIAALGGIFMDITERKRAEEALRESEASFAALFQHSPAPLVVASVPDGRYRDVNQAWVDMMGRSREQALGRTSVELGVHDEAERGRILAAMTREGTVDRHSMTFHTASGETRSALVSGREIELGGIRARIFGFVDVTDQQRAQRQIEELNLILERSVASRTEALTKANAELQATLDSLRAAQEQLLRSEKQAALGRLVAGVAHELNTPIGNAVLVAGTLREKVGAFAAQVGAGLTRSTLNAHLAASSEAAEMIERNLDKAASLIQSFKQVSADQASSQRRVFQLDTVINELLFAHQPMLRKSPIAVSARIPAGIAMDSYPGPLGQVIGNLINNSLLHAHEGRASGVIAIEARPAGSNDVEIVVRDDGHGIAEDNLGRVFDPFYTTKLGRGGTGLGLPICQNLVTQILGGAMRIESAPGKGTAVLMTLPLKAPRADAEPGPADRKEAA